MLLVVSLIPIIIALAPAVAVPISTILLYFLVVEELTVNHAQYDISAGRTMEGKVKNWELAAVKNALYVSPAAGPVVCTVGEEADAVSAPNRPDTSPRRFPWLNG